MSLEKELLRRPGLYKSGKLKKSYMYIAARFGVKESDVRQAVNNIRKGNIIEYNKYNEEVPKGDIIKSSKPNSTDISMPGTYFVTGCIHAPFHNRKMYESIYNYIQKEVKLKGVILAGDIMDMNSLSSHDRGKMPIPGVTLDYEYKETNKFLNEIDDLTNSNKIFLFGNHEDRYFRALSSVDISKYGSALLSPSDALKLADRGYETIEDWKTGHIRFGPHLEINHGEFINVHTAKKTIDTYRKSTLYFHTHRFQVYTEGLVGGWNMGWGGDQNQPVFNYASRAMKKSWMNSAALVTLDKDGYYHVQPLLYVNNRLIVNGKRY